MNEQSLSIEQHITIAAPIEAVWDFLVDEEKMKDWFQAAKFSIDLLEGGIFEIPFPAGGPGCKAIGEVSILVKDQNYVFVWWERNLFGEEWFNCTTVTISLKPQDDCATTRLNLIHDGFKNLDDEIREEAYQRYLEYWSKSDILPRLDSLISDMLSSDKENK